MQLETILSEKKDGTAIITLNRPHRLNAINSVMTRELLQVWQDVKQDKSVLVVIVTGAGDKAFCTGVDVQEVAAGQMVVSRSGGQTLALTAVMNQVWKPVITAVNGMVTGGGLHFVADTDICICSENSTFFDSHVNVGLVAALEPIGLSRRMPLEAVLRMAFLANAERITAQRAYALRLVSQVVPLKDLLPTALELAEKVKANSPAAMMYTKKAIWDGLNKGLEEAVSHAWGFIRLHAGHPDVLEGPRAFAEKRKPQWQSPE